MVIPGEQIGGAGGVHPAGQEKNLCSDRFSQVCGANQLSACFHAALPDVTALIRENIGQVVGRKHTSLSIAKFANSLGKLFNPTSPGPHKHFSACEQVIHPEQIRTCGVFEQFVLE